MNPRTTAVAFVLAAALASFVYFYEIRGEEGRLEAESASRRLFSGVEADAIESIALTTTDGIEVRIDRRDDRWELALPFVFPADAFAADAMASSIAQLESEAVYDDPRPREEYGLEAEASEVRFTAGGEEHALRVGDKTPMGANSYVWTSSEEHVYTVPTFRTNSLRKSLDELREKRLLRFDREAIVGISATWPDGRVVLERGDEGWRLLEPVADAADAQTVEKLLTDLSLLRAEGFLDESTDDEGVGLDRPAFEVVLTAAPESEGGEEDHLSLAIGAVVEEDSRIARGAVASLYRISAHRLDDFSRDVVDYRDKQLAEFAAADAIRVELSLRDEAGGTLKLVAERGETGWTTTPPEFDRDRVADLVEALSDLRASGILSDTATPDELANLRLVPANVEIAVFGGEGAEKLAEVQIGALRTTEGIAVRRADDETVFVLDPSQAEHVPVSLEAYTNRFVAAAEAEEVDAVAEPEAVDATGTAESP